MDCALCKTDTTECTGTVPSPEPEPEPEPEVEENGGIGGILIIVVLFALVSGGAFYFFKVVKTKQSTKGRSNLDDFDFGDDGDEETEFEMFGDEREDIE